MNDLKQRITEDMKTAMKGGDKPRLGAIRLILAALKQREVDERIELDDPQVLQVLEKMLKQRRDSVAQYEAARREDLAAQERYEIGVIEAYLPAQLGDAELGALVAQCIAEAGATSPRDMGKVMALLKERAAGRADMGVLSQRVKAKLAG
ncbi:MAG TPA: GatB/YqeY domain-containing protein [Rhodanobacteraceae bacterium]|nr:GatB/YqeY domain-containing protein [Rhodanobacteraceae bacterium]